MNNRTPLPPDSTEALLMRDAARERLDGYVLVSFSAGRARVSVHAVSPGDVALAAFLVEEDLRRRMNAAQPPLVQRVAALPS